MFSLIGSHTQMYEIITRYIGLRYYGAILSFSIQLDI